MAAPDEPVQTPLDQPALIRHDAADLTLFAAFSLTALVLSSRSYRDELSAVTPLDLALAWGPSSDPAQIRDIKYWQHDRWYTYRSPNPISSQIRHSSSNMHMIPAHPAVQDVLEEADAGNVISIAGHLCDIKMLDGTVIRSSRTRKDKDGGACEIVFVSRADILT